MELQAINVRKGVNRPTIPVADRLSAAPHKASGKALLPITLVPNDASDGSYAISLDASPKPHHIHFLQCLTVQGDIAHLSPVLNLSSVRLRRP